MARKKKKTKSTLPQPAPRSDLHRVLAGRKGGSHRPDELKRMRQKLQREIEES